MKTTSSSVQEKMNLSWLEVIYNLENVLQQVWMHVVLLESQKVMSDI